MSARSNRMRIALLLLICAGILVSVYSARPGQTATAIARLNADCPPGFKKNQNNECEVQTLYKLYDSPNGKGVGGLKTALPEARDGFTPQQIDLGRYLFFDPLLSADRTMSCASCHQPEKGFSDGRATSMGSDGKALARSAPSLWNVAYLKKFFWDGRAHSLEEQMQEPLFAANEMNNSPESLLQSINEVDEYRQMFAEAYPTRNEEDIQLGEIYTALAAFQSSLISLNSKYDQYAHGYPQALDEREIEGLNVFRSFVARCAECHTPPLFSNQQIAVIGTPEPVGRALDIGAQGPTEDASLRGGFKVPSLRNIDKTAPYMHSGIFKSLRETVQFYTDGRGHAVPKGENLILHWHIWEPNLTSYEMDRLVDFLKTLTDESFLPKIPHRVPSGLHMRSTL